MRSKKTLKQTNMNCPGVISVKCHHTALFLPPTNHPTVPPNSYRVYKYLTPPLATLCLPITAHTLSQRVRVVQIKTTTNSDMCLSLSLCVCGVRFAPCGMWHEGACHRGGVATAVPTTYGITMSKSERLTVTVIGKAKANPILSASIN